MIPTSTRDRTDVPGANARLTFEEYRDFIHEIEDQPAWRAKADIEMDYVDGNQLNSEILRAQREIGMPPAIEPLIGPAIDAVLGLEAKNRADWRVEPNSDSTGDDIAKALGFELNQAERRSKADRACSEAYRSQICVGLGWVEVSRETNPFKFPYRCHAVHRNEIHWDMLSTEDDLGDARYLVRRRWTASSQVKLLFPKSADLVDECMGGWSNFNYDSLSNEGGQSTSMLSEFNQQRGWTIEEQQWRDSTGKRVCLYEVWYRRWARVLIIKTADGRVVEYDKRNQVHVAMVATRAVSPEWAVIPKMRTSIWMGPHCLKDEPTPFRHQKFPYVPFWGKKEDRTGVPYGLVRGMIFMQDNVNATTSKLRWGLAAVRVTRTEDVLAMTDQQMREEIARPDADIVLKSAAMKAGGMFEVERDFNLSAQQFQLLQDSRIGIQRVSGITDAMRGSTGTATSGVQEATQVEQGTQALADINDNFNFARAEVGELLLSLITEDLIGKRKKITVPGQAVRDDKVVELNAPRFDDESGLNYLDNDVERAMLKVAINDVPSTSSYRAQQLSAMSEAFKAMPVEFQRVTMPYLVSLMDLPSDSREDVIRAVREASVAPTAEQIEQQIAKAVQEARVADSRDLKLSEMAMRYSPEKIEAEVRLLVAKTFGENVKAFYAAGQTAASIAAMPQLAPVADSVAQLSGYQPPNPAGVDPNIDVTGVPAMPAARMGGDPAALPLGDAAGGVPANTSPMLPPVPQSPPSPGTGLEAGSETQRFSDNVPT